MKNFDLFGNEVVEPNTLKNKYIIPPFSIFDTASGDWQNRKNKWKSLGIKSEIGRENSNSNQRMTGSRKLINLKPKKTSAIRINRDGVDITKNPYISIFDPVLCEVIYNWFAIPNGTILDPFSGGSVRGIVANYLGYKYTGIDLREEQILSNQSQALKIIPNNIPKWIDGDSDKELDKFENKKELTPFQKTEDALFIKREDYAGYRGEEFSSGTKIRAYEKMIKHQKNIKTLAVGCSADSLMQVYVSEMAKKHNLKSKIFIPHRKIKSDLTKLCYKIGSDIEEIPSPCYPAHYRKKLKEYAKTNPCAIWDSSISTEDTAYQIKNLPKKVKRIIVSCGSGAITIGIAIGLILEKRTDVKIISVKVSSAFKGLKEMHEKIKMHLYNKKGIVFHDMPNIKIIEPVDDYSKKCHESLKDGTELDYLYSAKAYRWLKNNKEKNDCFWISGRRPNLKINYQDNKKFDFVFSCPPYYDLEVYCDNPNDLSNMDYNSFNAKYDSIINKSCKLLRDNRFACFVVGNVRDKNGYMIDLVGQTIKSFENAGLKFYNEIILKNQATTAALRADNNMTYKKVVKIHQNVLVFCKGNPKSIV